MRKERRRFKRYKIGLDADYTGMEGYLIINSLTTTRDISLGGLRTILSKVIRRGSQLLIQLRPTSSKGFAVLAKVVWLKRADSRIGNTCGLKFLWISSEGLLGEYFAHLGQG